MKKNKILDKIVLNYSNNISIEGKDLDIFPFLCLALLSHRTNDKTTNKLVEVFSKIKTPNDILKKTFSEVFNIIRSINYSHRKTKILFLISLFIKENFNNIVPIDFNLLISIPYIGPKTASLINSNFSNDVKFITIDTHVERFFSRFFKKEKNYTYEEKNKKLKSITSSNNYRNLSDSIIGFAKKICTYKPKCNLCFLKNDCYYYKKKNS